MSDLTDNLFYLSAERIWLYIRLNNAEKWACKKKIIFSDEAHFDLGGYLNKQNCRILGHRKPARVHWKADAPKTSHCLVRILVQRNNWATFLRKWARRGRYSQWQSLSGHVEWIFVYKNWRKEYWQHLVSNGRCYMPHSRRSHYQPSRSCDLTPLD